MDGSVQRMKEFGDISDKDLILSTIIEQDQVPSMCVQVQIPASMQTQSGTDSWLGNVTLCSKAVACCSLRCAKLLKSLLDLSNLATLQCATCVCICGCKLYCHVLANRAA